MLTGTYKPRPFAGFFGCAVHKGNNHPLQVFLKELKSDVYAYCHYVGFSPTWQQRGLLDAIQEGRTNIAVRSGQGPGKTAATAVATTWWSITRPYSLAVVTAPTMRQCSNVWLSEAQAIVNNGDRRIKGMFHFTDTGYGILGASKKVWGCYLATATRPEAFQGIHREHLMVLCEESSGISRRIIDTIKGTLTNAEGSYVWVQIGNPNTRTCAFFDCFHTLAGSPWHCLHWNAEQTPESGWFSRRRNEELAEEFGRDSDVYRVRVLGEFPSIDPDSLISDADLQKCFGPEAYERAFMHEDNKKQIGIDLARFGGDECVNVFRAGRVLLSMTAASHVEPYTMIDRAVADQDALKWKDGDCLYVVDTSGMGEGAVGHLGAKKRMGKRVHEFYSQNTASDSSKYENKITEAWCGFAKMVRSGDLYLGEKPDRKLVQQLAGRKYYVTKNGRICIESKDEYKKRNRDAGDGDMGKSPDRADAVIMAFYDKASQSQRFARG